MVFFSLYNYVECKISSGMSRRNVQNNWRKFNAKFPNYSIELQTAAAILSNHPYLILPFPECLLLVNSEQKAMH